MRNFIFHSIQIRIRCSAKVMINRINMLPTNMRRTTIVRSSQVPINVLIRYRTTRTLILQIVRRRIACHVTAIRAEGALMASIKSDSRAAIKRMDAVMRLRVQLIIFRGQLRTYPVRVRFVSIPTLIILYLYRRRAIAIPVRFRIDSKEAIFQFMSLARLCVTARVKRFSSLNVRTLAANEFLIAPIVNLDPRKEDRSLIYL